MFGGISTIYPSTINEWTLRLLTHEPNDVHITVTLRDSTVKEYDHVITPGDFTPITMNIPH